MAKLEFYRQQTTPRVIAPDVGGLGRIQSGFAQAGEAIARGAVVAGQMVEKRNLEIEKRREDEAAIDASAKSIELTSRWMQEEQALQKEAEAADDFETYADKAQERYNALVSEYLPDLKSDKARDWFTQRSGLQGLEVQNRSMQYQARSSVAKTVRISEKAADEAMNVVIADPSKYPQMAASLGLISDRITDADARDKFKTGQTYRLAQAATVTAIGRNPYAMRAALEKPKGERGYSFLDALDPDSINALKNEADHRVKEIEAQRKAEQAKVREQLNETVKDQQALALAGYLVKNPLTKAQFKAGGLDDKAYAEYEESFRIGAIAASFTAMSPEQIDLVLKSEKPVPDQKGFANRAARYTVLQKSAAQIITDRNNDPIQFAETRGLMPVGTLDPANPDAFAAELQNRATIGKTMRKEYNAPTQLLKKGEAEAFSNAIGNMTPVEKTQFLKQFSRSLDRDSYTVVMRQLAEGVPVTALAGRMMISEGSLTLREGSFMSPEQTVLVTSVASQILKGEELLNPSEETKKIIGKASYPMPTETLLRQGWNSVVGDAYRGDVQSELITYQAYRAYYAAELAARGNNTGAWDPTIAKKAARAVSGGVTDWNGSKIVLPFGMPADKTLTMLRSEFNKYRGVANIPKDADLDDYELMTVDDGVYAVYQGTYGVVDENGALLKLRIK
jgi:hypothetical protein